jgi:hypothetical protein
MTVEASSSATCANCGESLSGAYCGACGQSADELKRPFFRLAFDWASDLFAWDGRLLRTLRTLYARPGRVAREFGEGRRASYTPPVRLLLMASLLLFAAMSVFGLRIVAIAVDSGITPPGEEIPRVQMGGANVSAVGDAVIDGRTAWVRLSVTAFGGDRSSRLTPAPAEIVDTVAADPTNAGLPLTLLNAVRAPADLERAVNAAATQALFSMVAVFALLNAALHPRRRFFLHLTHALYFHAALALALAVWIVAARLASLSGDWASAPPLLGFPIAVILFDRGCYGTTWLGRAWRMPLLIVFYLAGLAAVLLAFTVLLIPR